MRSFSLEENKKGIRLKFVEEKFNQKEKWWIAIGETPFFWLIVLRYADGTIGSAVHMSAKDQMVPFEEKEIQQESPTGDEFF